MDFTILPLFIIVGFLTKFADLISDDGLKVIKPLDYLTGIMYGVLISYIVYAYPVVAPLAIAVVVAVIATGKIDSIIHSAGIAAMLIAMAYFGLPEVNMYLLAIFFVAGIFDEIASDIADSKKKKGLKEKIMEKRLILEATVFIVSILTGEWMLFAGILSFDIGYQLTTKFGLRLS